MPETLICAANGSYRVDIPIEQIPELHTQAESVFWLDISDPNDQDYARLSEWFQVHPLAIEDIRHGTGRAKIEVYEGHYFILFYAVKKDVGARSFATQPVFIFAGEKYFVTVHQGTLVQIEETMHRWRDPNVPPADRVGALLYALLDTIVDDYFPLLDDVADEAEHIEDQVFERFERSSSQNIFALKRELLALRRVIAPGRDVLNVLMRRELPLFRSKDMAYLQDIYDHILRINDSIDNYRDLLSSAL
ncbi:MAG: magnesium transporter CorA family protein, partial [Roseiflexaceae bacterium]|nr:magnesium transporter CorA family protein [Roseiflexaceae bacterium]